MRVISCATTSKRVRRGRMNDAGEHHVMAMNLMPDLDVHHATVVERQMRHRAHQRQGVNRRS